MDAAALRSVDLELRRICRFCLRSPDRLANVCGDREFALKIATCMMLEVSARDGLPATVCEQCLWLAEKFYLFKDQCTRAELILRSFALSGVPLMQFLEPMEFKDFHIKPKVVGVDVAVQLDLPENVEAGVQTTVRETMETEAQTEVSEQKEIGVQTEWSQEEESEDNGVVFVDAIKQEVYDEGWNLAEETEEYCKAVNELSRELYGEDSGETDQSMPFLGVDEIFSERSNSDGSIELRVSELEKLINLSEDNRQLSASETTESASETTERASKTTECASETTVAASETTLRSIGNTPVPKELSSLPSFLLTVVKTEDSHDQTIKPSPPNEYAASLSSDVQIISDDSCDKQERRVDETVSSINELISEKEIDSPQLITVDVQKVQYETSLLSKSVTNFSKQVEARHIEQSMENIHIDESPDNSSTKTSTTLQSSNSPRRKQKSLNDQAMNNEVFSDSVSSSPIQTETDVATTCAGTTPSTTPTLNNSADLTTPAPSFPEAMQLLMEDFEMQAPIYPCSKNLTSPRRPKPTESFRRPSVNSEDSLKSTLDTLYAGVPTTPMRECDGIEPRFANLELGEIISDEEFVKGTTLSADLEIIYVISSDDEQDRPETVQRQPVEKKPSSLVDVSPEEVFECEKCDKFFPQLFQLEAHLRAYHNSPPRQERPQPRKLPGKLPRRKMTLVIDNPAQRCPKCGVMVHKASYWAHIKSHTPTERQLENYSENEVVKL